MLNPIENFKVPILGNIGHRGHCVIKYDGEILSMKYDLMKKISMKYDWDPYTHPLTFE